MEINNRFLKRFLIVVVLLVWLNVLRIGYINLWLSPSRQRTTPESKIVTTAKLRDTSIKRRPGFAYPTKGLIDPFREDRGIRKKRVLPRKKETKVVKKKIAKIEKAAEVEKKLPLAEPLPTDSSLFLTIIIWDEVSPVAVLQERGSEKTHIVRVGDLVIGERVEDIAKDSVTVSKEGMEFKLRLGESGKKKKSPS